MARPRRTVSWLDSGAARRLCILAVCACHVAVAVSSRLAASDVTFESQPDRVEVLVRGRRCATYVYQDDQISRPYWCNVLSPSGRPVTRPLPIPPGELADHPEMHPGLWMAFGDLSGHDYWRLKAPVKHVEFIEPPTEADRQGTFAVRNRYLASDGIEAVAEEICRYTILAGPNATTILWDSTFRPHGDEAIVFGDQEEMGLGVRLVSSIAEKTGRGGRLRDSEGRSGADRVWGQAARWCDYSGPAGDGLVGVTVAAHPENFRRPWWHARNYGFMAANPFGRQAMRQGPPSRVDVAPGDTLRLRFAVIVHDGGPAADIDPEVFHRHESRRNDE